MMDAQAGQVLLPIARAAIAREFGRTQAADEAAVWLRQTGATFITLKQGAKLRGCIGTLRAHRPLLDDVKANAVSAAFRDPRFRPLTAAELDMTRLELSLLSAVEALTFENERDALSQLRPGVDGVILQYGYHQSTFLPQVWDELAAPTEFMAQLKRKAGLPPDFWEPEMKLARYTVSKWTEPQT